MKKYMNRIVIVALSLSLLLGLTACKGANDAPKPTEVHEKPAAAYVVCNTANTKAVDISAPMIQGTMEDLADNYGYCVMVRVDSAPEVVVAKDLDIPPQYKKASAQRLKADAIEKTQIMLQELDAVAAVNPEVDYLEALRVAAACLRSLDESYTSRTIICCGSGLSTAGLLDFRNNLLNAEPGAVVKELQDREALPDLDGISVVWLGMAQVASPQDNLTPKQTASLERLWCAIIEASGGKFDTNDFISVEDSKVDRELPAVSTVTLAGDPPIDFSAEENMKDEDAFLEDVRVLDEKAVTFIGNQAEYVNPDAAMEAIRPIGEFLLEHKTVNLVLIGTTAGDVNTQEALMLSADRAAAVRDTLIAMGVDGSRLTTMGLGCDNPWHKPNVGYGALASSNRAVYLLDTRSEQAKALLSQG